MHAITATRAIIRTFHEASDFASKDGTSVSKARLVVMPSAVIQSYAYNAKAKELSVIFRSGSRYIYEDVPPDAFNALNAAFSKGEFFQSRIRSNYAFRREYKVV